MYCVDSVVSMEILRKMNQKCLFCGGNMKMKNDFDDESLICQTCKYPYTLQKKENTDGESSHR